MRTRDVPRLLQSLSRQRSMQRSCGPVNGPPAGATRHSTRGRFIICHRFPPSCARRSPRPSPSEQAPWSRRAPWQMGSCPRQNHVCAAAARPMQARHHQMDWTLVWTPQRAAAGRAAAGRAGHHQRGFVWTPRASSYAAQGPQPAQRLQRGWRLRPVRCSRPIGRGRDAAPCRPRPRRPRRRRHQQQRQAHNWTRDGTAHPLGRGHPHCLADRACTLACIPCTTCYTVPSTKATQNATQVVALSTLAGPQGPSRSCYVLRVRVFDDHWRPLATTGDQWFGCSVRALIRFRGHYDTSGAPDSPPQDQGRVWMPSEKALEAYDRLRIWSMPPKGEHRWRKSSVRAHTCKSLRHARSTRFASAGPRSNLDTFCADFRGM